jgi:hypothetical protein
MRRTPTPPALLILAALLVGCGSQSGLAPGTESHASSGPPNSTADAGSTAKSSTIPSPIIVRKPLTAAQRQVMLAWMTSWRSCMTDQGVNLPPPEVHPRDISIDVSAVAGYLKPNETLPSVPSKFQQESMGCATTLGGPPATFLRTAGIVDLFHGTCALAGPTTNANEQ